LSKIAIDFTGVRATALIELYARWLDARDRRPILGDPWAERVVERLDFDFAQFRSLAAARFAVGVRSRVMDGWVSGYLSRRPGAVVMDLGSGLDSRFFRVDPPEGHHWYDVDFPDVVQVADQLYPERAGRSTIGASVTEPGWLGEQVARVLREIVDHFPEGEIVFNTYSALVARRYALRPGPVFRKYGISITWTLEEPREVEEFDERLSCLEEASQVDSPLLAHAPLYYRAMCGLIRAVPSWRYSGRVLRYGF
jgi:O-methyltransferase involved in polyketide biosynthesis